MILSAFADEISFDLEEQISVLGHHGIRHVDLRGVGPQNVLDLDDITARRVRDRLHGHGISIAAIASPIGKQPADCSRELIDHQMRRAVTLARIFETRLVRVFAFYPPHGTSEATHDPSTWRDVALQGVGRLVESAHAAGITLLLENEHGTYADTAERYLDVLTAVDHENLKAAFDPVNLMRCGESPYPGAYETLKPWIRQIHVKDMTAAGELVVAGGGDADWPGILRSLRRDGYAGVISLEPHLAHAGRSGGFTGPVLFESAFRALQALMEPDRPTIRHRSLTNEERR